MKKNLFLFLIATIMLSCSSNEDMGGNSSSAYNPPSWIQGTWGFKETGTSPEIRNYRFTSDNVCQLLGSTTSLCWKESIQQAPNVYSGSDKSTSTAYEASFIGGKGVVTVTLKFEKISATQIKWVNIGGMDIVLDKLD